MKTRFRVCGRCEKLVPVGEYPPGSGRLCRECAPPPPPPPPPPRDPYPLLVIGAGGVPSRVVVLPAPVRAVQVPKRPRGVAPLELEDIVLKKVKKWQKMEYKKRKENKRCQKSRDIL